MDKTCSDRWWAHSRRGRPSPFGRTTYKEMLQTFEGEWLYPLRISGCMGLGSLGAEVGRIQGSVVVWSGIICIIFGQNIVLYMHFSVKQILYETVFHIRVSL